MCTYMLIGTQVWLYVCKYQAIWRQLISRSDTGAMGGKQEQAELLVLQPHLTAFCVSEKNCIFRLNTYQNLRS
jgi:hypothetical protein